MRYWWVNQNQTHQHEIGGGYLWSPKRSAGDRRNPFYEFMREVSPGDVVFSFFDTYIFAIGIAASYCRESPKPLEFGGTGMNWQDIGWKIDVNFVEMLHKIRPKNHVNVLGALLPRRYSPLQASGNGNQGVYLTAVPTNLARALVSLIGQQAAEISDRPIENLELAKPAKEAADMELWEHHLEQTIVLSDSLTETERQSLIVARRGQGLFKQRVMQIERSCRVTRVNEAVHLRASH